ncbi:MAG: tRNA (adenosine(37)-N6)-threonylcarbamoyltransferase complex dimerization subunit type 1 TsaB [Motiliproteus sp.]
MAKILALDTSSEACSVALLVDQQLQEIHEMAPRQHTQKLLPMVQQLLDDAGLELSQLDGIGFGAGPGSFTGLRITAGVAQGLAFGADLPLFPVSTLAALAEEGLAEFKAEGVLAALDARMGEIYWGVYQLSNGIMVAVDAERVCAPEQASIAAAANQSDIRWLGIGSGWNLQSQLPQHICQKVSQVEPERLVRAGYIARIAERDLAAGKGQAAETALPVYLRDEIAWKKSDHRR